MISEAAIRVARRFVAEVLTKQWLMGVRRGWLSLLKPHVDTWPEILKAIDRLDDFVTNLEEQVVFVRRGPWTNNPNTTEGAELRKLLKTLHTAISEQRSRAKHWQDAEEQDEHWLGRGTFTKEQGEQMRQLYTKDFGGLMTTYVKTKANPAKGSYIRTREANLTELLDKILDLLRQDAKRLEEAMQAEEEHGIDVTRQTFKDPAFKEFTYGRMKVIVVDPKMNGNLIREYVHSVDEAYALLRQKGFGKLWYGAMFLKSTAHELTKDEKASYAEFGYADLERRAGAFHSGADVFEVTTPPGPHVTGVVVHELGHRYWFKFMSSANRAKFNALVQTNVSKKVRDFPSGPTTEEGILKPVLPVSNYGRGSIDEAFAVVFEHYVQGKDLSRDQLESFRAVLAAVPEKDSLAQHLVSRFIHAGHL